MVAAEELTTVCCVPPFIAEGSILDTSPLEIPFDLINWSIRWKLIDLIRWKPIDSKNRINVKKLLDLKVSDFNFLKL